MLQSTLAVNGENAVIDEKPTPAIIEAVSQELRRLGAWDALPGDAAEQIKEDEA